ncbi:hydroxyneurosporene synthase (CrtC) [Cladophialophora psammophila CBS 110553]|uniref:Hydroxyneurosporene synthase (CrtC) n=1 Tax=Cladophialophora psammophila CBS 110553 TaxID=1182543 RepID=W9X172_9EURO|nr:hydroxyneurosporene synthase (CrtC) [Cladophialophora psammophila CBS 110553]EXJ70681.1 hydroxyneurosporene synthase (CrtC) [Cladophialophora psammophila CBS 110553]
MRSLKTPVLLSALLALAPGALSQCFNDTLTYSSTQSLTSTVQFTSCDEAADGPRVFPIDLTSYDWWYFDTVSDDGTQALTIIFFASSFLGFSNTASIEDILNVAIAATFPNGTQVSQTALATAVTVNTIGNGASGDWTGSGCSFTGTPDLSQYAITINNPSLGISGTVDFVSRGPGHYPCSPLVGGADEQIMPHVGWANVLPAADATVHMNFGGSPMNFQGNGYHDKNWGDIPFVSAVQSWYWGHGTFGDYHMVWYDALDSTGSETVSGYLLKDGQVVGSTCALGSAGLQVRPVGTPYPPTLLTPNPTQFTIVMKLDNGEILNATVTPYNTQVDSPTYSRWFGNIAVSLNGVESSGSALWEQFKLVL